MRRLADLVIHLPVPHTGADDVAGRLTGLRGPLRDHGVALVHGRRSDRTGDPVAYAHLLRDRSTFERRRTATRPGGEQTVLVHDDGLLGPAAPPDGPGGWYPQARTLVEPLVAALRPARTTLLLTVRRQDRWLERQHLDDVLRGSSDELDAWLSTLPSPVPDYAELAQRLSTTAGVSRLEVLPVEAAGDDPARLARLVVGAAGAGLGAEADDPVEPPPGPACSPRGVAVARALNAELDDERERRLVRRFVLDTFPAGIGDLDLFAPDVRRDLLTSCAEANRRLFARHQPAVDPAGYADEASTARIAALQPPGPSAPARVGPAARAFRQWDRVPSRWRRTPRVPSRGRARPAA